jgi:hypothetical protein
MKSGITEVVFGESYKQFQFMNCNKVPTICDAKGMVSEGTP